MKNKFYIVLIMMIFPFIVEGQTLIKQKYFKNSGEDKIVQLKIFKNINDTYKIFRYYKDGQILMEAISTNANLKKITGKVKFYKKSGVLASSGEYTNSVISGEWTIYDTNGEIDRKINYDFSKLKNNKLNESTDSIIADSSKYNEDSFQNYIMDEMFYPPLAALNKKEGKVIIGFAINTSGNVVDVEVKKKSFPDLDKEAMRVILNMPQWTPGYQRGKPVKVQFVIPLNFKL